MVTASKSKPKPGGDKDQLKTDRKNLTDDEIQENLPQKPTQRIKKDQGGKTQIESDIRRLKRQQYFDEKPELNPMQIQEIEQEGSQSFYRRSSDNSYTLRTPEENIEVENLYQRRIFSHPNDDASSENSDVYQKMMKEQEEKMMMPQPPAQSPKDSPRSDNDSNMSGSTQVFELHEKALKRPIYYGFLIYGLISNMIMISFSDFSVGSTFPNLIEEFDGSDGALNSTFWLFFAMNASLLGTVIANYTFDLFFKNYSPYEFIFYLKILIIGGIGFSLIPNREQFLMGRFGLGLMIGYCQRCCETTLDRVVLEPHRRMVRKIMECLYSFNIIITFMMSTIITRTNSTWRFLHLFYMGYGIFEVLLFLSVVQIRISPYYEYKFRSRDEAKKVLEYYLNPIAAESLLKQTELEIKKNKLEELKEEEEEMKLAQARKLEVQLPQVYEERSQGSNISPISKKSRVERENSISKPSSSLTRSLTQLRSKFSYIIKNKVQIINTFKLGFIYTLSLEHVFKMFVIFLMTMNYKDPVEFARSLTLISVSGGLSLVVRIIMILVRNLKIRRVYGMMASMLLFSIALFVMAGLQFSNKWDSAKYLVLIALPAIDGLGATIYSDFVDELFIRQIAKISNSNTRLYWLASTAGFSLLHFRYAPETEGRSSTTQWVIACCGIGSMLLFYFFTNETYGKNIALALEAKRKLDKKKGESKTKAPMWKPELSRALDDNFRVQKPSGLLQKPKKQIVVRQEHEDQFEQTGNRLQKDINQNLIYVTPRSCQIENERH